MGGGRRQGVPLPNEFYQMDEYVGTKMDRRYMAPLSCLVGAACMLSFALTFSSFQEDSTTSTETVISVQRLSGEGYKCELLSAASINFFIASLPIRCPMSNSMCGTLRSYQTANQVGYIHEIYFKSDRSCDLTPGKVKDAEGIYSVVINDTSIASPLINITYTGRAKKISLLYEFERGVDQYINTNVQPGCPFCNCSMVPGNTEGCTCNGRPAPSGPPPPECSLDMKCCGSFESMLFPMINENNILSAFVEHVNELNLCDVYRNFPPFQCSKDVDNSKFNALEALALAFANTEFVYILAVFVVAGGIAFFKNSKLCPKLMASAKPLPMEDQPEDKRNDTKSHRWKREAQEQDIVLGETNGNLLAPKFPSKVPSFSVTSDARVSAERKSGVI